MASVYVSVKYCDHLFLPQERGIYQVYLTCLMLLEQSFYPLPRVHSSLHLAMLLDLSRTCHHPYSGRLAYCTGKTENRFPTQATAVCIWQYYWTSPVPATTHNLVGLHTALEREKTDFQLNQQQLLKQSRDTRLMLRIVLQREYVFYL